MAKKAASFRALSALMALLFLFCASATTVCFDNAGWFNNALNIETTVSLGSDGEYAVYWPNDYGYDNTALIEVYNDAVDVNVEIAREGVVLMKNENNALPLAGGARVTIFGNGAVNSRIYQARSANEIPYASFVGAMQDELGADNVNTVLCTDVYTGLGTTGISSVVEADIDSVTAYASTWQSDYNDAAVVVLCRNGSEGNDVYQYSSTDTYADGSPRRMLDLSTNETALMEYLQSQKQAGVFGSIVVVLASEFAMELGFLDDYDVDACLLIGNAGSYGCTALAEVISGAVNPSGRTVDTYAASSISAPAVTYAGVEGVMTWGNADELNEYDTINNDMNIDYYIIYAEGVYVGYKYYETRYEDCVMNLGGAAGSAGVFKSEDGWNYADEMCYTFGHGLSYTSFEQTLDSTEYNAETDEYVLTVTVKNTGSVAGKDVVEVYAQTPYGDYERQNLVEKPAVSLAGFEKTGLLQPGESETVTVSVPRYFLASYDTNGAGTYILSAGDYYLSVGRDAHDALNNILAAKGYTTADGMTADGNAALAYSWNQAELDTETYSSSIYTGNEIENSFADADLNYYDGYEFEYLTRSDWEGTFPSEQLQLDATKQMMDAISNYDYETPADAPAVSDFTQGADNGITLTEMVDVDFDDPKWDEFVDQLTVDQMANLWTDNRAAQVVTELEIPGNARSDDDTTAAGGAIYWVSHPLTARTWSKTMANQRGLYEGLICTLIGRDEIWYGAGNLHRTPYGGRANQYWSEDATLSYIFGYNEAGPMQSVGCHMCVKHMCCNDQESQRTGLTVFVNEQSLREIYLRAFEGSFAGGALSVMATTGRVGTRLGKNYEAMMTTVLRGEWGFEGHVTSDGYVNTGYYNNTLEELVAGQDYSCSDGSGANAERIVNAINAGDGYILQALRQSAKRNLYVISRSASMNGLGNGGSVVSIVPGWEMALFVANIVLAVGFVACLVPAIVYDRKSRKEAADQ